MPTCLSTEQSHWLDACESSRVLEEALDKMVPVQLSAWGAPDGVLWRGAFGGVCDGGLLLVPSDKLVHVPTAWYGVSLRATFCVANRIYVFETALLEGQACSSEGAIGVVRPACVERVERRRALRRRFRSSTGVQLYRDGVRGNPIEGVLLNLSALGLACRVDAGFVKSTAVGLTVRVAFDLGCEGGAFEFDASVVCATPNGEGDIVLGLEFIESPKRTAQQDRLKTVLYTSRPRAESE